MEVLNGLAAVGARIHHRSVSASGYSFLARHLSGQQRDRPKFGRIGRLRERLNVPL